MKIIRRSARPNYGDKDVGYVQLKRVNNLCYIKSKITPEHKIHTPAYNVEIQIDENLEVIRQAKCFDCVAAKGNF